MLVSTYKLNPKTRLLGVSNGGLISYAWAFRNPDKVERIFCVYPVMDMHTWPGLAKVAGPVLVPQPPDPTPGRITPEGLKYDLSFEEFKQRLAEFNPVDNLAPLAEAKVKILHIHGDADKLVPMEPNSGETMRRYKTLGGEADLEIVPGGGHGGMVFFEFERGAKFLVE
jgi:pimeloyl-ACP methyl ester carboxylesterase